MAITSEIIGKLGGGDVEVTPVEGAASGLTGTAEVLSTIEMPPGETWLVAVVGQLSAASSSSGTSPVLHLGDQTTNGYTASGYFSMATLGTGVVRFQIQRNRSSGTDSFTGHVYTVKM